MWVIDRCIFSHWIIITDSLLLALLSNSVMNLIHVADAASTRPQSAPHFTGPAQVHVSLQWAGARVWGSWMSLLGPAPVRWPPPQVDLEVAAELSHTPIPAGVVGTGAYCPDTPGLTRQWEPVPGVLAERQPRFMSLPFSTKPLKHLLPGAGSCLPRPTGRYLRKARLDTKSSTRGGMARGAHLLAWGCRCSSPFPDRALRKVSHYFTG